MRIVPVNEPMARAMVPDIGQGHLEQVRRSPDVFRQLAENISTKGALGIRSVASLAAICEPITDDSVDVVRPSLQYPRRP